MRHDRRTLVLPLIAVVALAAAARAQDTGRPDTVVVHAGALKLRALLWSPAGPGPFPAVLFNHGSYGSRDTIELWEPTAVGPVFAGHGYVFLFLFRSGVGLSADQGTADGDLMDRALAAGGQAARNQVQLELLETEASNEAFAGLAFLRALSRVDAHAIAVVGHSFGGSLSLLLAARDTTVEAAVVFGAAANSWARSPDLQKRLLAAINNIPPVLFIHAANDYSTAPGKVLAEAMQRLGRPHRLTIYPAVGQTAREGHNLVYRNVATWETDVFGFLDPRLLAH